MANSEVWINGTNVAKRPNGYIGFRCELTGRLVFGPGKTNLVAVRADTSRQPASRYYAGAGIYRHTRLVVTEPVHFTQWGIFVTTPKISTDHDEFFHSIVYHDCHQAGATRFIIQVLPAICKLRHNRMKTLVETAALLSILATAITASASGPLETLAKPQEGRSMELLWH